MLGGLVKIAGYSSISAPDRTRLEPASCELPGMLTVVLAHARNTKSRHEGREEFDAIERNCVAAIEPKRRYSVRIHEQVDHVRHTGHKGARARRAIIDDTDPILISVTESRNLHRTSLDAVLLNNG